MNAEFATNYICKLMLWKRQVAANFLVTLKNTCTIVWVLNNFVHIFCRGCYM